ncbi:MAG: hypothetical protein KatS3mg129_0253 [Leptospiraceae bacterium]|nr:MAG: hypothetical protein KatS3mg129_0253 [Leptospiraceae bacterium]
MKISLKWIFITFNAILFFLITFVILILTYYSEKQQIIKYLRGGLEIFVVNASLLFDGEDIKQLNQKEDWKKEAYHRVYQKLKDLYILNYEKGFKENQIYILKPLPEKNKTIFAAHLPGDSSMPYNLGTIEKMADPQVNYIGDEYEYTPLMKAIMEGKVKVLSTDIYTDAYGMWISAYAPIKDKNNQPIAILEADYDVSFLYQTLKQVFMPIMFSVFIIGIFAFLVVLIFSNYALKPIEELVFATQKITSGIFEYRIPIKNKKIQNELDILKISFNEMASSIQEKVHLSSYVSKETLEKIQNESKDRKYYSKIVEKVILFTDIRGFTKFSENRQPEEVVYVLNSILGKQTEIIEKYYGKVDKFVGDEVVATFDISENIADKVMECTKEIFEELKDILDFYQISIGIGIHIGTVLLGDIGAPNRKDFTIIGSNVNLCARLCSGAKSNEVLISKEFYDRLKAKEIFHFKGNAKLKGFSEYIPVYSYQF